MLSRIHLRFSRTKPTTVNTITKGWLEQAAVHGTMFNLHLRIEITTQTQIMKSIHTAARIVNRKPQINNNTAISRAINIVPVLVPSNSPNSSRIVIKRRLFNRRSRRINSSSNKGDPSTKKTLFIPTGGICCLKIICEHCWRILFLACLCHPTHLIERQFSQAYRHVCEKNRSNSHVSSQFTLTMGEEFNPYFFSIYAEIIWLH